MRKLRVLGRSMPVFLACWEYDNLAYRYHFLLPFRSHNALSCTNYEDLTPGMHVEFIPHASTEIHDAYAQIFTIYPCINKATFNIIEKDVRDLEPAAELFGCFGRLKLRMNIVLQELRSNDCAWHPPAYNARLFLRH